MTIERRTNQELYALIEHQVLPKLKENADGLRDNATEIKALRASLSRAGLDNGHGDEVKQFFDRRAKREAGLEWLGELLQPVARFKSTAAIIGFLATAAWGVLALQDLLASIHPSHP